MYLSLPKSEAEELPELADHSEIDMDNLQKPIDILQKTIPTDSGKVEFCLTSCYWLYFMLYFHLR